MDVVDQDGNGGGCGSDEDSWGPTWNTKIGGRCPFDDPGVYSTMFGRANPGDAYPYGAQNMGFGASAGYTSNSIQNNKKNIHMYVR